MNQLSDNDLELAKKHGFHLTYNALGRFAFTPEELATYNAERDAYKEQIQAGVILRPVCDLMIDWKTGKITGDELADKLFSFIASTPVVTEQQPNAEAVAEVTKHGVYSGLNVIGDFDKLPVGTKLFTHAQGIPEVLFDGYKVYQELTKAEEKRTSYENVSDVLDAVVRILRRNQPAQETKL